MTSHVTSEIKKDKSHMSASVSRRATARWSGTTTDGSGELALGSGAFTGPYTLKARVDDVRGVTNPEELIAAASAGCFTMSLSSMLEEEGTPAQELETTGHVRLEQVEDGFRITRILLEVSGAAPGVAPEHLAELAESAKSTCPVSLALAGTEIVLRTSFE
jgi:osmotically inducible protein OsmC